MPRYFFDLQLGDVTYSDDEGMLLKRRDDAFGQMAQTLLQIGQTLVATPGEPDVVGIVRDDRGVLWRGRLSLHVQRFRRPEPRAA
jgi:hypothetical protein